MRNFDLSPLMRQWIGFSIIMTRITIQNNFSLFHCLFPLFPVALFFLQQRKFDRADD